MLVPKIKPSKIPLLYVWQSGLAPKIKTTLTYLYFSGDPDTYVVGSCIASHAVLFFRGPTTHLQRL
jgi:hypothetical protein